MKQLFSSCHDLLEQFESIADQILPVDFSKPSSLLGGSTVGQHVRHALDLFLCLRRGLHTGTINYDNRQRDKAMENDKAMAIAAMRSIRRDLKPGSSDKALQLEMCLDRNSRESIKVDTTYYRELAYNIDHMVHHLAMVKIGLSETAGYVKLSKEAGIAVSTIRYQELTSRNNKNTVTSI